MKLIREILDDPITIISEAKADGTKEHFINGIFLQAGVKNRNGRIYPLGVLENEVLRYTSDKIQKNRAYGELDHPPTASINLQNVSHHITELTRDGQNFIGKAKIASTPMGNIVKNLLSDGANLGVSSRGVGNLKENASGILEVQADYKLITAADIVSDPSAPSAFVHGILENVEFWFDETTGSAIAAENAANIAKHMKGMTKAQREENMVRLFELHLKTLQNGTLTVL
jgi:hypothetical protein